MEPSTWDQIPGCTLMPGVNMASGRSRDNTHTHTRTHAHTRTHTRTHTRGSDNGMQRSPDLRSASVVLETNNYPGPRAQRETGDIRENIETRRGWRDQERPDRRGETRRDR